MKISEIMTQQVRTLSPQVSAVDGIHLLLEGRISGLPVVDGAGKIVGMFTEKDVLKAILPSYVMSVGRFTYENSPKTILGKIDRLAGATVGQLMRKEVVKIRPETPVSEVARIMLTQNVRRIPVVDSQEKLVGIVARADVLSQLLKK